MAPKKDRKTAGQEFLTSLLSKVAEDKRALVQEALAAEEILNDLGDGVLRHQEFSRLADGLRESETQVAGYKKQLDDWYAQKQRDLEELDRLRKHRTRPNGRGRGDDDDSLPDLEDDDDMKSGKVDLTGYVKAEDVDKMIASLQQDGLALMSTMTTLATKHLQQFNEVLDTEALLKHAAEKRLRLDLAYEDYIKPRVEERQKKDIEDRITKAREEAVTEERRRVSATPYPVSSTEPTTLDGLKLEKRGEGLQRAVDEYYRSQRPA